MHCPHCQTSNETTARTCSKCGASFAPLRTQLNLNRAATALDQGNYDLANAALADADREMLALTTEQRNQLMLTAQAFHLQAMIYYGKGLMTSAREELLSAQRVLEANPNGKVMLANVLNLLGNTLLYLDQIDESTACYQHCIEIAVQAEAHDVAAKGYGNLASTYLEHNQYDKAIATYTLGLEHAVLSADSPTLAQSYRVLALLHSNCGPFPLAIEYADKALALRPQVPSAEMRSLITSQAAAVYIMAGDYSRARFLLHESYMLAKQSDSELAKEGVAVSISELLRDETSHEPWFAGAMKVFRDIATGAMMRDEATLRLAIYYISQGNPVQIRRHLHWVRENFFGASTEEDALDLDYANALLYTALGEYDAAAAHFKFALDSGKFFPYQQATAWRECGQMLLNRAEEEANPDIYLQARAAFGQAATTFRRIELAYRLAEVEQLLNSIPYPSVEQLTRIEA